MWIYNESLIIIDECSCLPIVTICEEYGYHANLAILLLQETKLEVHQISKLTDILITNNCISYEHIDTNADTDI